MGVDLSFLHGHVHTLHGNKPHSSRSRLKIETCWKSNILMTFVLLAASPAQTLQDRHSYTML